MVEMRGTRALYSTISREDEAVITVSWNFGFGDRVCGVLIEGCVSGTRGGDEWRIVHACVEAKIRVRWSIERRLFGMHVFRSLWTSLHGRHEQLLSRKDHRGIIVRGYHTAQIHQSYDWDSRLPVAVQLETSQRNRSAKKISSVPECVCLVMRRLHTQATDCDGQTRYGSQIQ